jgi:hypothetical protein
MQTINACPNCGKDNINGVARCVHCDTELQKQADPTGVSEIGGIPTTNLEIQNSDGNSEQNYLFALHHRESGKLFSFANLGSFTLGRISEGQSVLPDVDFAPIQGFEAGVSRLHAMLNINEADISLTDLGSSNGTIINGERISEKSEQNIKNGDMIQLGRLQVQAMINSST